MIEAIEHNLKRGVKLLNSITDFQYSDTTVEPYHSSIGGHMRHILDVFDCIFCGLESKEIDLTARKRNELAENKIAFGLAYFEDTFQKLAVLKKENFALNLSPSSLPTASLESKVKPPKRVIIL